MIKIMAATIKLQQRHLQLQLLNTTITLPGSDVEGVNRVRLLVEDHMKWMIAKYSTSQHEVRIVHVHTH